MDDTEAERVEEWNRDFFVSLGFESDVALELAVAGVDPHDVQRQMLRGCSRETARLIFAPIESRRRDAASASAP